jgi:effector-binding domain-containing protein
MKRIFIIIGIFIILLLVILFIIPVKRSQETAITANFFKTIQQINNPANWKNWHPAIRKAWENDSSECRIVKDSAGFTFIIFTPQHSFFVKVITPVTFEIQEKIKTHLSIYGFTVVATKRPNKINILSVRKQPLFYQVFSFIDEKAPADVTLQDLKSFVENRSQLYGFQLKIIQAEDTIFATRKGTVALSKLFTSLPDFFKSVNDYIDNNGLTAMSNKCVSYTITGDSVFIMTGIPVNKAASEKNGIMCMKIPFASKVLYAYFEGKFSERKAVYSAMEKYILDFNLEKAALPYEKYVNNILPASDSEQIKIEVFYPLR